MNNDSPRYKIGEVAKILGITVHTLRLYEKEGLIIPYKKSSNQRLYTEKDIERLKCIRYAINNEKISIEGIKRILSLIPCWAIIGCTLKENESCGVLVSSNQPCWMYKHKNNFCSHRNCRECEVYNLFNDCKVIKSKIVQLTFFNRTEKKLR